MATFVMDFDPVMLMSYLARQPMHINQFQLTIKWLEGEGEYFTMQQRAIIAQRMSKAGIFQRKIAEVLEVSERTIRQYLKRKATPVIRRSTNGDPSGQKG